MNCTKPPTTKANKADLIKYIEKWDEPSHDWPQLWRFKKTNAKMLEEAKRIKPSARYLCQKLADQYGVAIILLPAAHPDLNPIELRWGQIKARCAKVNQEMKLAELKKAGKQHLPPSSASDWEKLEMHIVEIEDEHLAN